MVFGPYDLWVSGNFTHIKHTHQRIRSYFNKSPKCPFNITSVKRINIFHGLNVILVSLTKSSDKLLPPAKYLCTYIFTYINMIKCYKKCLLSPLSEIEEVLTLKRHNCLEMIGWFWHMTTFFSCSSEPVGTPQPLWDNKAHQPQLQPPQWN